MSSMISYFNDRILSPEMMRAMIILYIGPHNRPDFSSDYLLSPILAPDSLLQDFPKTYFLTGERDPLVDDTVIFAGRLRRAKAQKHEREKERKGRLGREFDDLDVVEVALIPGISHGFLQFVGCFPEGWKYIHRCGKWMQQIFAVAEERDRIRESPVTPRSEFMRDWERRRSQTSSGEEDAGLEMSSIRREKGEKGKGREREREEEGGERRGRGRGARGSGSGRGLKREENKSMVKLASEDDLLGRRMLGLAGPLTGMGVEEGELFDA